MLSYTINKINETSFIITYNYGVDGLRPINFAFVYDCMCPFSFKQINQFVDNSINQFNFTDNIYYNNNNNNNLTLTYYMYEIVYDYNESMEIMNILKQSLQDIIMHKSIIACSITKNKQLINAIEKGNINYLTENNINSHFININNHSALYYAVYYKQYDVIEWLLNNNIPIEFIDLEFSDETSRHMLFNAKQCPSHIKMFLEKDIVYETRKRKSEVDDFHSKIICI
jgi:hypothetical protein